MCISIFSILDTRFRSFFDGYYHALVNDPMNLTVNDIRYKIDFNYDIVIQTASNKFRSTQTRYDDPIQIYIDVLATHKLFTTIYPANTRVMNLMLVKIRFCI